MLRKIGAATFAAMLLLGSSAALAENCSGTTLSTNKQAYSASNVKGASIMNNSANLICIAFDVAATMGGTNCGAGSYALQPGSATAAGGSYTTPDTFRPSSINVISTAGSDAYSCTRW